MVTLGIGTADTILDRIVEKFDVELECADIEEAISSNYYELGNVGNMLIRYLYDKVIEKGIGEYGLKKGLFSYYLNMSDSHLYYDGKELYGIEDLENLQFEEPEDDSVEDNHNAANEAYLSSNGFNCVSVDNGWELENFTDGGEDMIIYIDNLTKKKLIEYLNNFNVNEETMQYWPYVSKQPFDNIRDFYNDLENWKEKTLRIAERMPY
jgi:hypothetical protein